MTPCVIDSGGLALAGHLARPETAPAGSLPTLVLAHGLPREPGGAPATGRTYPELAHQLAKATGWAVLTFNFRGTGQSAGSFSPSGWLADLQAAVDHAVSGGAAGVWLAGSSLGGSLAIVLGADDERVKGVVTLAAPASFDRWAASPKLLVDQARSLGMLAASDIPPDPGDWARDLRSHRPLDVIGRIPPRPVMIVHGTDDETVPTDDARALAEAAGDAELRILAGAGHRLRHDPRTTALIIGWMERRAAL